MKNHLVVPSMLLRTIMVLAACVLAAAGNIASAQGRDGTDAKIVFANELEEQARVQLRRLLADYDLDPWIFTTEVRIAAGEEPHSMPVLTLNTDFLDDDEMQLSIFVHEQVHWFVAAAAGRDAAIEELRAAYPEPPRADTRTYQHLLVAWIELDAMAKLIGKEKARRKLKEKVARFTAELDSKVAEIYRWYNYRVLEDTGRIGKIAARHGVIVAPE